MFKNLFKKETVTSREVANVEDFDVLDSEFFDALRLKEFKRLDDNNQIYLDYTGGSLYPKSIVDAHHDSLINGVYGNPHSVNPASMLSTQLVSEARKKVLEYFNAKDDYVCVFTYNASAALKIIGECYPFSNNSTFLISYDNHNSVNGIREYAKKAGAECKYVPLFIEDLSMDESELEKSINSYPNAKNKLLAYPAQSNVTGTKHPLKWVAEAKAKGWDVLLDAAAYVPTNKLDLQEIKPDFVPISFYKIFGYPTGIGCLLARKEAYQKLEKKWFAGGTVQIASVLSDKFFLSHGHEKFENGTVNFLGIPAIINGLNYINSIGIERITGRVKQLVDFSLKEISKVKHSNGSPVVKIITANNPEQRGSSILMKFFDDEGTAYTFWDVEQKAKMMNISLRAGCFCNPGVDELNSSLSVDELNNYFNSVKEDINHQEMISKLGKLRGAVRISVGVATNKADIQAFFTFLNSFIDKKVATA